MQHNRHEEAKDALRRALTCLQQLVGPEEDSEFLQGQPPKSEIWSSTGSPMDTTDTMQGEPSKSKIVFGVSIEHPLCKTNASFLSASPDNLFDFYNRAFIISSNIAGELPLVYESVTTAVLLYNTGLTCYAGGSLKKGAPLQLYR
jgi:hypothetical protein